MSIWRRLKNLWVLSGLTDLRYLEDDIRYRASTKSAPAIIVEDSPLDKIHL